MFPTCNVLCSVHDEDGAPVAGALITAELDRFEVYQGYVVPGVTKGTTALDGTVTLALWPNALGATESSYTVRIATPDGKSLSTTATVPNVANANLHEIANLPPYPGKSDAQLIIDAAIAAAAPATEAKIAAEAAQLAAETARAGAETARDSAVAARVASETARDAAASSASTADTAAAAAAGYANTIEDRLTGIDEALDSKAPAGYVPPMVASSVGTGSTAVTRIMSPEGAALAAASNSTGAIKITLPPAGANGENTMLRMRVEVFDYGLDESVTLLIAGHYDVVPAWSSQTVTILGQRADRDYAVRFGNDATGPCLWIGEVASTWSHLRVYVSEAMLTYNDNGAPIDNWKSGWSMSLVTAFDTVDDTITGNLPFAKSDAALVGFDGGTIADFFKSKNARVVDSISALKALDKTKSTRAFVTGYYAAGDGGGGMYWYDSTDTTAADNGGTVIVATDGGRWKLILEQSITNAQFGAKNDGVTDDTAANQAAITWCVANHKDLNVTGLSRVTASLNVDRQVDGAAYDSYFRIFTTNGGGFYVDSAIAIFSSTIAYTTAPVSQLVQWDGLRFVSSDTALAAYVLDGPRFLRSSFVGCSFSKIKCMLAATYAQSIYFINCNARRWTGAFFKASPQAYDIQVIGGLYEAGGGNCFELSSPIGCKFHTQIEGMAGTALQLSGCQGVDICTYFEQNGLDFDCRTGGLTNRGVNIHGSYFANSAATYTVKWGAAQGCVSTGNWHTNNMHDLQSDSIVEINDVAQTNLSNTSEQKFHGGYRQGSLPTLSIRGANSAAYSVSGFSGRYTRSGNRMDIQFVCTLTSTGSNPQDDFYIPALPFDAAIAGPLCGSVHVVGSSVNNGISPISMTSASPGRVQSSLPVIPANVAAAAWTVRGHISYEVAS